MPTEKNQEIIDAIVGSLQQVPDDDPAGESIRNDIPTIIMLCDRIVAEEPDLIKFVESLVDYANRSSLTAWAAVSNARMGASAWDALSDGLKQSFPSLQLE